MKLYIPATTTNFGSGFDAFGLALNLYNVFQVWEKEKFEVEIEGEGSEELPKDESNLTVRVYKRCCEVFKEKEVPFKLLQINNIPVERGLGSSATAIVGGIEIFQRLHSRNLTLEDKLKIAFEFEKHPDNIIPAFVGGFVICLYDSGNFRFKKLNFPDALSLVFVVPDFRINTEEARRVLPQKVSLKEAVFNLQRSSLLIASLLTGDYSLISVAVEDKLHQPYRSKLISGFESVKERGYKEGAYGVFISGSGPTICAICKEDNAKKVGDSMKEVFERRGVRSKVLILKASNKGCFWSDRS